MSCDKHQWYKDLPTQQQREFIVVCIRSKPLRSQQKHLANYCEYFEMERREFVPPAQDRTRESKARDALKKLLGD